MAVTEVPNPVDEIHHLAYVHSIATGRGIPQVGTEYLPRSMLELMRESPTFGYRRHALDPKRPQDWGEAALQYEGVQPPLYYLLMAPAFHAGRPWGVLGSLYAVRLLSLLVALASVPMAWLLARELFPGRPQIWVYSSVLPVVVQGFNANLASVTNDALAVTLGAGAALAIARGVQRPSWTGAGVCGAVIGLAMLAKLNAAALIPVLAVALVLLPRQPRRSLWWRIRWGALAAGVAGALASLWFLWNTLAYGELNGASRAAARLLAPLQVSYPFSLTGLLGHLTEARRGFWQFERLSPPAGGNYAGVFLAAAALAVAGGLVRLAWSRDGPTARRLTWLASCWPVAFAVMVAIVYIAYTSTVVGRHTYPALIPLLVFLAGGILLGMGRPLGPVALATLVAVALWMEQAEIKRYVDGVYLEHIYESGLAPVWEQPVNQAPVTATGVTVRSSCPVEWLGLGITGTPPLQLEVASAGGIQTVQALGEREGIVLYRLQRPAPDLEVRFGRPLVLGARPMRSGRVRLAGQPGGPVPMAQIQCRTPNGAALRFEDRFRPLHSDAITYRGVSVWARAWALAGVCLVGGVSAFELRRWTRERSKVRKDEVSQPA